MAEQVADEVNVRFGATIGDLAAKLRSVADMLRGLGPAGRQAGQQAGQGLDQIRRQADQTSSAIAGIGARLGPMIAALASIQTVRTMAALSDQAAMAAARIQQVTGSAEGARDATVGLYEMAQRLQAPFGEAQAMFARMMPAVAELKGGTREAVALSEVLITTAKLAGASAAEAAAGALQFAQAMASGVLQGDELKSLLENNPVLARELSAALGVTIGDLRKMGEQGKLTADIVGNALLGRFEALQAKAAELPVTIEGSFTVLTNAAREFFVEFMKGEGVFTTIAKTMREVARVVEVITQQMRLAGTQSGLTGQQTLTAAQVMAKAFAYVADVVRGLLSVIRAAGNGIGAVVAAIVLASQDDYAGAARTLADGWRQATAAAAETGRAIAGNGKALQAYNALLAGDGVGQDPALRGGGGFKKLQSSKKPDAKGGAGEKDAEGKLAKANAQLAKAQAEAELAVQAEALRAAASMYEDAYQEGLIDLRGYYDAREAIARAGIASARKAKEDELAAVQATIKTTDNAAAKVVIQAQAAKLQGELNALTLKEAEAVRQVNAERRRAEEDLAARLAEVRLQAAQGAMQDALSAERDLLTARRQMGEVSAEEQVATLRSLQARALAVELEGIEARRAMVRGSQAEQQAARAQLDADEQAARRQHQQRLTEIDRAAEAQRKAAQIEARQGIIGGFQTMIQSLLSGTTKLSTALRQFAVTVAQQFEQLIAKKLTERLFDATGVSKLLDRMLAAVAEFIASFVAQWVGGEAAKTAATVAGEGTRTAATVAGATTREGVEVAAAATSKSLTIGQTIAAIGAKAWEAAANVYAAISAIPIVGPVLAPAAAVAAGATVLGFVGRIASSEGGEYRVDQDRLNIVHRDETILPAGFASGLRRMIGEGGPSPLESRIQDIAHALDGGGPVSVGVSDSVSQRGMWSIQNMMAGGYAGQSSSWALPADPAPRAAWAGAIASPAAPMAARGGDSYHVSINAVDAAGFEGMLQRNRGAMTSFLARMGRDRGT